MADSRSEVGGWLVTEYDVAPDSFTLRLSVDQFRRLPALADAQAEWLRCGDGSVPTVTS